MTRNLRTRKLHVLMFCAVAAAVLAGVAALSTSSSTAATGPRAVSAGGLAIPSPAEAPPRMAPRFGHRVLKVGMTGEDVQVLNGIVKSKSYARQVPLTPTFETVTASAVKEFQSRSRLRPNGVVNKSTAKQLIRSMRRAGASWYGPGLYGNSTACGQTLRATTFGVAHKTLPCGTKVLIAYKGRFLLTRVIDRGPYIAGRAWDLTKAAADSLGYTGADPVRYAVASPRAR